MRSIHVASGESILQLSGEIKKECCVINSEMEDLMRFSGMQESVLTSA